MRAAQDEAALHREEAGLAGVQYRKMMKGQHAATQQNWSFL